MTNFMNEKDEESRMRRWQVRFLIKQKALTSKLGSRGKKKNLVFSYNVDNIRKSTESKMRGNPKRNESNAFFHFSFFFPFQFSSPFVAFVSFRSTASFPRLFLSSQCLIFFFIFISGFYLILFITKIIGKLLAGPEK